MFKNIIIIKFLIKLKILINFYIYLKTILQKIKLPPPRVTRQFNSITLPYGDVSLLVNSENDWGEVWNASMEFTSVNSAHNFSGMSQSERDSLLARQACARRRPNWGSPRPNWAG
jgi:hypothetical protein